MNHITLGEMLFRSFYPQPNIGGSCFRMLLVGYERYPLHRGDISSVENISPNKLAMCPSYRNVVGSSRTSSGPIGQVWGDNLGLFYNIGTKLSNTHWTLHAILHD